MSAVTPDPFPNAPVYVLLKKQDWPEIVFSDYKTPLPPAFLPIVDFLEKRHADYGPLAALKPQGKGALNMRFAMQNGGLIVNVTDGKPKAVLGYDYTSRDDGDGGSQRCCHINAIMVDKTLRGKGEFFNLMRVLTGEALGYNASHFTLEVDKGNSDALRHYSRLEGQGLLRRTIDEVFDVKFGPPEKRVTKPFARRSYEGSIHKWLSHLNLPVPLVRPVQGRTPSPEARQNLLKLT